MGRGSSTRQNLEDKGLLCVHIYTHVLERTEPEVELCLKTEL